MQAARAAPPTLWNAGPQWGGYRSSARRRPDPRARGSRVLHKVCGRSCVCLAVPEAKDGHTDQMFEERRQDRAALRRSFWAAVTWLDPPQPWRLRQRGPRSGAGPGAGRPHPEGCDSGGLRHPVTP